MAGASPTLSGLFAKFAKGIKPNLKTFWYYAKVELTPPTLADIPQIKAGVGKLITGFKTGSWKQLTVRQAWLNTLVTAEVVCWFYIGECIGKRHLIGYKLKLD